MATLAETAAMETAPMATFAAKGSRRVRHRTIAIREEAL
jgi:hypothetical protein